MTEPKPATGRFAGLTAIVTGASRGIGLAITERLVAEGGRAVLTGRGSEALAEAVESLGGSNVAIGIAGHVGHTDRQSEVVALALDVFGRIDLLVNNTGINPVYGPLVVKIPFATAHYEDREDQLEATYPLKRLGVPDDIGSVAAFLLRADSSRMTGQTLIADGGVLLTGRAA
jgi:NAD(P)-dependent dehydrogenase (short-subunit alcohol dehydrogenase family)